MITVSISGLERATMRLAPWWTSRDGVVAADREVVMAVEDVARRLGEGVA